MNKHPMLRIYLTLVMVCGCSLAGCTTGRQIDETIAKTAKGSVALERIPDLRFQAAHPIALDREIFVRSLHGVQVIEKQDVLHTLVGGKSNAFPAFSEDDLAFLAPLIAEGLAKAAPDQQVAFRILQRGAPVYSQRTGAGVGSSEPPLTLSPEEFTSGNIFAYGRSLYLSLSEVRHRRERPDTINMANRRLPDPTGLVGRDILFAPDTALRSDMAPPFAQDSAAKTLVIDYELLMKLPASAGYTATPSRSAEASQPANQAGKTDAEAASTVQSSDLEAIKLEAIKEEMKKKDSELEELRKELGDIKRQLDQQAERSSRSNGKPLKSKPKDSTK